ncbi:type I-G CRISPR-associated protein Csb2 [Nocardia camponoti]|uniref:Type I-U CRISPR-associated protein Cas5/Cas6 n=1 Tax=Nocardia camponoti TaxID=1616106 RepID=A0A917QS22_9NOCA|nr:type I-U CRISPR-associated protein Csb2 [Nocardia camponoti]GGK64875.1 hypothetical protein GCM10011591_41440 [Nocardia camponoti]
MTFSIVASYPLSTFRGSRPDGTVDRVPSVARLHSALLAAAGFGPRAMETELGWGPSEADEVALRWLEDNPPNAVTIPPLQVTIGDAIAYRDDGTIGKTGKAKTIRKLGKQESVVAVDGEFVWTWRQTPPPQVAESLRELCPDVPHLGTAESPVIIRVVDTDVPSTHEFDPTADLFHQDPGYDLDLPLPGRADELMSAHTAERTGKVGSDRAGTDERSTSRALPRAHIRSGRYRAIRAPQPDVPWPEVLVVPLDSAVAEKDRVRVAVAAHRTLIKILDRLSPPILTGDYADPALRPANRVAIQVIDRRQPTTFSMRTPSSLAIMIPPADRSEIAAVLRAVHQMKTLRPIGGSRVDVAGQVEVVAGDQVWREPEPGKIRLWKTSPPAVPDTRGYRDWTFTHAVLLSLGYIWQGTQLIPPAIGTGAERANSLVDAVNAANAVVLETDPVRDSSVHHYVHKVNKNAIVRPYRARLTLGDLCGASTLVAIGQARHLGGGLLVPDDRPEGSLFIPGEK